MGEKEGSGRRKEKGRRKKEKGRRKEGLYFYRRRKKEKGRRKEGLYFYTYTHKHTSSTTGKSTSSFPNRYLFVLCFILNFMMFYKTSIEVKTRVVVIFFSFKCLNHHLCSDFAYTIMVHAPHPSSSGDPHLFIQLQAHVSFLLCIPVICVNLCCDCSSLFFNYLTFPNRLFLFFGTPVTAVRTMPSFHSFVADMVHHNRYF